MLLITHIAIALLGIVMTAVAYALPSKQKLYASCAFVGLTLGSGTLLVVVSHSPLLEACITGLLYLAIVFTGIIAAYYKLAASHQRINK